MARRSAGDGQVSSYQGRFHRTLGKTLNDRGELVAKKFLLGTDRRLAELANLRLQRLWEEVVAEHEAAVQWLKQWGSRLGDSDLVAGEIDYGKLRQLHPGPRWRAESLRIAEAVRQGEHEIAVEVGADANRPATYVERVSVLRRTYSGVTFMPASTELYLAGQQLVAGEARELLHQAQELSAQAQVPLPQTTGQTLYQALDAYAASAIRKNPKESGQLEANCARRLKDAHPDLPLEQFGISAMEAIAAYWASRPLSKRTGRPVALATITNHLKTARRFIQWLHRSDAFAWSKPIDAEVALRVRVKRLRNDAELAALSRGVAHWTVDELAILYRYATDRERFLILWGLNCAFAQSEFCTLRHDEVVCKTAATGRRAGATVKRIRRKTQIYGEFLLWPETVEALEWFVRWTGCAAASGEDHAFVLITQEGRRYDRQRLANLWNRLLDRVQADHPSFRRLPFKHLRKTAGQLVKRRSDGEVAGVFLCHGTPVATDELSDAYTNRPFDKVAEALTLVRDDLHPVLDAVTDAFTDRPASSPNVSRATIERIRELQVSDVSVAEIARSTGVTIQTVRRWTKAMN